MGVQCFVKGDDLKKLIDDKLIHAQSVKHVLVQKGILPICTGTEALSDLIYHHFFGSATMTQMQEVMNFEQNNLKSTVVVISPKSEQSDDDFLTSIADEFVKKSLIQNSKYSLRNISRNPADVTFQYAYTKPQRGRIKIAEERTVYLDVTISPLKNNSKKFKVSIRHEGLSDSKQFLSLLDEMIKEDNEPAIFNLKRIALESLLKAHKVDFFDEFSSYHHDDWQLIDITDLTVNKDEKSIDSDDSEIEEEALNTNESTGQISTAILKGDRLRHNDFVRQCMSKGYIFSSMHYKFTHKKQPVVVVIDVNFKAIDLKINIEKTYRIEEEKEHLSQLSSTEQTEYIGYFQNVAYEIYSKLIEKQKQELTATPKP